MLRRLIRKRQSLAWLLTAALSVASASAQTVIKAPKNKFSAAQDVQLGREAAAEVEKQLPLLTDGDTTSFIRRIGDDLEDAIPPELRHPEFEYSFKVVNQKEINAFALPGGPMYVNRGMIQAAQTEGEVAGVVAHEISHIALRHGTAQMTKAQKYQLGALAGAIAGAVIGGGLGQVVYQGSQFGIGAVLLRFSRDYEKEADLLGSQIMARAGYNPIDMANMFQTIERQGGGGGPQWLSDHPNPGNRSQYIQQEARSLRIENPVKDTGRLARVQSRLNELAPAPSAQEIARARRGGTGSNARIGGPVAPPSSSYRTYQEGNLFRVSVPANWREAQNSSSVRFAPDGAYGEIGGQPLFTHGVEIGLVRNRERSLEQATDRFLTAIQQGNRNLRQQSHYMRTRLGGRDALFVRLSNVSEATGRPEVVNVQTTFLRDGNLFYVISVTLQEDYSTYEPAFQRVARSIRITD